MRIRFFSYIDGKETIIQGGNDIAQLASEGFNGFAEIVDDENNSLCGLHDVVVPEGDIGEVYDVLFDLIGDLHVGGVDGDTANMVYTTGDCDLLARAIAEMHPEGQIVGVFDPLNEDGKPYQGPSHLIHAGVLIRDEVIDIYGISKREDWVNNWSLLGSLDSYFSNLGQEELQRLRPGGIGEDAIASARVVAELFSVVIEGPRLNHPQLTP